MNKVILLSLNAMAFVCFQNNRAFLPPFLFQLNLTLPAEGVGDVPGMIFFARFNTIESRDELNLQQLMKKNAAYRLKEILSSLFMILALAWLTISIPFVYNAQQELAQLEAMASDDETIPSQKDECSNPLSGTNEEKAPSNTTLSEEWLHNTNEHPYFEDYKLSHNHRHSFDIYVAFHGELITPPPNLSLT